MPTTFVMVGAPGSGKSTLSRELNLRLAPIGCIIDPVQVEADHPEWRNNNRAVFAYLQWQLGQLLDQQRMVIYDATNAVPEHRRDILRIIHQKAATGTAIWLDTPIHLCLERAFNRPLDSRQVALTPAAIERMAEVIRRFPPCHQEGFDRVFRVTADEPFPFDQL